MKKIKEFLALLKPYKNKVALAFIAIIAANLLGLAFPWALKVVIDEVLPKSNIVLLNLLTALLILTFILKFYFGFLREYLFSFIGESVVCDLRNKLYWHLQRLSVKYVEDTPKGSIISGIIGDVESIKDFLFAGTIDFVYSFFNILFVLVILFALEWRLALVSLLMLPAFGLSFIKLGPGLKGRHSLLREKYAELTSGLNEVLNGMRIVAGFAKHEQEMAKFSFKQKEIFEASMETHKLGAFLWMYSEFISSLGLALIIWLGARYVFSGRLTAGALMAFYTYLGMLFFPVIKMVVINSFYQEAVASMERIDEVLCQEPLIKDIGELLRPDNIRGAIEFRDVSFSYDKGREVLSGINLEVRPSEVVAIVGKSGAGKTTLINLLLRFYEPQKGAIFIDGYNLKDLELKSYRSKVAMVIQDDYLFSASVKENILYSRTEAAFEEVLRAAKAANAHQFIMELADGYDTQIGERGIKLSYGQRQRISIARAMLREPAILILDEATSSVDSETERLIIEEAFNNLMAGRTTFIIAHRLSTVNYAHKIVVIEEGRIAETGKHLELLKKKGSYWRFWKEQNNGAA